MLKTLIKTELIVPCFLVATVLLSSCANIRVLTYPPDFTWIGKEQLKTSMHEMGNSVSRINALLEQDKTNSSVQLQIVEELDNLEAQATSLSKQTGWSITDLDRPASNHPLLDENLDEFIRLVDKARLQAQATPPSFYSVGKITGGCSSCHRIR